MSRSKAIAVAVLAVLIAIVAIQNRGSVQTDVLFVSIRMPLAILILVTAALGFVAGLNVATRRRR